jgi:probable HAF family extracellular repeat protein
MRSPIKKNVSLMGARGICGMTDASATNDVRRAIDPVGIHDGERIPAKPHPACPDRVPVADCLSSNIFLYSGNIVDGRRAAGPSSDILLRGEVRWSLPSAVAEAHAYGPWLVVALDSGSNRVASAPIGSTDLLPSGSSLHASYARVSVGTRVSAANTQTAVARRYMKKDEVNTTMRHLFAGMQMRLYCVALTVMVLVYALTGTTIPSRAADSFSFTTIDVPGATETEASGINNAGQIVGFFRDAGRKLHGFMRTTAGALTTIDGPDAGGNTEAYAINDTGQIVGGFNLSGFLRTSTGAFTTFLAPGAMVTYASGINNAGQIVGRFNRMDFSQGSFFRAADGTFTFVDVRGDTTLYGINDAGQIVGSFFITGVNGHFGNGHGFLRTATGTVTTIDVPSGSGTSARGINNAGQIVGEFFAGGKKHGFFRTAAGGITTIDVPGATETVASGINNARQIVGSFKDTNGKDHGFVTTR